MSVTPIGFFASSGGSAGSYELISSSLLANSTTTSVTFSSILQTYKHLQIRVTARTASTDLAAYNLWMTLNGITTATYSQHALKGSGTAVTSNGNPNLPHFAMGSTPSNGSGSTVSAFSAHIIDVADYASTTKLKTMRSLAGYSAASAGTEVSLASGLATSSTNAVTSLSLDLGGTVAFLTGSRFSLYGIKG